MKKALYILYVVYQFLVIAACVYLPLTFGFGVEYILLGVQAVIAIFYFMVLNPQKNGQIGKRKNEFSLFISVLFVGIIYIATLHILVIILSAIILAGWFYYSRTPEKTV